MRKIISKIRDLPYAIAAAVTVATMAPAEANANGNTVGTIADGLMGQISSVGKAATAISVVGGIILVGTGLLKLKQASDSQGRDAKWSDGLIRCVVGGGLIFIPAVTGSLGATFGWTDGATITAGGGASF